MCKDFGKKMMGVYDWLKLVDEIIVYVILMCISMLLVIRV